MQNSLIRKRAGMLFAFLALMGLMIVPAMAKTKPTVAIIRAEWCSACQKLEPTMMELRQGLYLSVTDWRIFGVGCRPLHGSGAWRGAGLCWFTGQCLLRHDSLVRLRHRDGRAMIALGTFSGALTALPRSGEWMVKVKKGFSFAMLLIAQYLLIQAGQRFI